MRIRVLAAAVVFSALAAGSGCSSYPTAPSDQATFHVKEAREAFDKGKTAVMTSDLEQAIQRSPEGSAVSNFLRSNASARRAFIEETIGINTKIDGVLLAGSRLSTVELLQRANVLDAAEMDAIRSHLNSVVSRGNSSGSIEFKIGDAEIERFSVLQSHEAMQIILDRTIDQVRRGQSRRLADLIDFASKRGPNSAEYQRVRVALDDLPVTRSDLDVVARVFPEVAAAKRALANGTGVLTTAGADRIFEDDLKRVLSNSIRGMTWVTTAAKDSFLIRVERVRFNETTIPERTQTVTYSQFQVNLLEAALLMPRNASYLFDITTGGAEIEYGFVLTVTRNGTQLKDEVVRGRLSSEYRRCTNQRIQNVFGGVAPAGFVANDDMRSRCSGGDNKSIDTLRTESLEKISASLVEVEAIRRIHLLN